MKSQLCETVFAINSSGVSQAMLDDRFAKFASNNASENLQTVGLMFWYLYDTNDQFIAATQKVTAFRLPSVGVFGSPLTTSYFFAIPRSAVYKGRYADVKRSLIAATTNDGQVPLSFMQQSGLQGSDFEGLAFDATFNRPVGSGGSATRLINRARESGLAILRITSNNQADLQALAIPSEVKADIQNAIAAGREAIVPEGVMSGSWHGVGYILTDPATGAGAYMINGGYNGGVDEPACGDDGTATAPVTTPVAEPHYGVYMLIAFAAIAILAAPFVIEAAIARALFGGAMLLVASVSNSAPPPNFKLSPGGAKIWDSTFGRIYGKFPSGMPETSYPGYGISRAADNFTCTTNLLDKLKYIQDRACEKPSRCKGNECDTKVLQENVANGNACIQARIDVMQQCFNGGDKIHWEEIGTRINSLANCADCMANLAARQCKK